MPNRFIYYDIPLTVRVKTPVTNPMAPRRIKAELKEELMGIDIAGTLGEIQVSSVVERSDAALRKAAKNLLSDMRSWVESDLHGTSQFAVRMAELDELAKIIG